MLNIQDCGTSWPFRYSPFCLLLPPRSMRECSFAAEQIQRCSSLIYEGGREEWNTIKSSQGNQPVTLWEQSGSGQLVGEDLFKFSIKVSGIMQECSVGRGGKKDGFNHREIEREREGERTAKGLQIIIISIWLTRRRLLVQYGGGAAMALTRYRRIFRPVIKAYRKRNCSSPKFITTKKKHNFSKE